MARYLLVAHQTAERSELLEAAKELAAADNDAEFTLLVPATPVGDLLTWEEGETKEVARQRSESAAMALKKNGIDLVGARVGDADPVLAVGDEYLAERRYDAIVISTLPPGLSRWIKMDVVSRLRRTYPRVRVVHVVPKESQPQDDAESPRGPDAEPKGKR
jgi:hypothetical protein